MPYTMQDVVEFVTENDVKFVRFAFCDLFGKQKNISIITDQIMQAFQDGIPFDGSAIDGFTDVENSDLFLFPIASTFNLLPWRPQQGRVGRVVCEVKKPDGSTFQGDTRSILKNAVKQCQEMGYLCQFGVECEFYLFKTDDMGQPTKLPFDDGGYLDVYPLDKGENVRREICLAIEQMGLIPETSHHEEGPGQNEIDFEYSGALSAADGFLNFKSAVANLAAGNGLFASFMPKPLEGKSGSGLHLNISLIKDGVNIFDNLSDEKSADARSFIAGILARIPEITAFLNPIVNSYDRLGDLKAPEYVSWDYSNRSQLIRIPAQSGKKSRMELRSPDPTINPYLSFALIINAGLEGIRNKAQLQPAIKADLMSAGSDVTEKLRRIPQSLGEAVEMAKNSEFIKSVIGEELLSKYTALKEAELKEYNMAEDKEKFCWERYYKVY